MSVFYPHNAFDIFFLSLLLGAFLGVLLDGFVLVRMIISFLNKFTVVWDVIFAIASAVVIFCFTFCINDGVFRLYELLGISLGILVYHFTISKIVILLFYNIFKEIRRFFVFLLKNTVIRVYITLDKLNKKGKIIIENYRKAKFEKALNINIERMVSNEHQKQKSKQG